MNTFDFEEFRTYLRVTHNKNQDTTAAIIRDVKMYLNNDEQDNATDCERLLNIRGIEMFVEVMQDDKHYKATTRAEKLRRIKLAIKCLLRHNDDQTLYYRGSRTIDYLDELCHGLGKEIAIQRQEHALLMRGKLNVMVDPNEFLENDMVRSTRHLYVINAYILIIG